MMDVTFSIREPDFLIIFDNITVSLQKKNNEKRVDRSPHQHMHVIGMMSDIQHTVSRGPV